ncbi:MAG: hypothetical protein AB9869_03970 [Verrucomicrobiia bacterium]
MKWLLLVLAVLTLGTTGCHRERRVESRAALPACPIGSADFTNATPPQFHALKLGMAEDAVLGAVGKPDSELNLWSAGRMGEPPVGKQLAYRLEPGRGVVWVDLDEERRVSGVFWRDRD